MKSLIVFYSYSGNTKKVAIVLEEYLKTKGEAELVEIKGLDESGNFFAQAARAFQRKRGKIAATNFNLAEYDTVYFGTPVWAFGPTPAMNAYLDSCFGAEGKDVVIFTTYGSGTGNKKCIDYMIETLAGKGAKSFRSFSIQQFKVEDKSFVLSQAEGAK